jgi:hypothetical protein
MAAYRSGRYPEAQQQFGRALDLDSTFVLAALGYAQASVWTTNPDRGLTLAWAARDRLSASERALVIALGAGPNAPSQSTMREDLAFRERAVEAAGDRPEAWFWLGDGLFHWGSLVGVRDWRERAVEAFRRALEADSLLAGPLGHLLQLAIEAGDSAAAGQLADRYFATSGDDDVDALRWMMAAASNDTARSAQLRARFEDMPTMSLHSIWGDLSGDDFDRVRDILRRRAASPAERASYYRGLRFLLLDRGHPRAAAAATDAWAAATDDPAAPTVRVLDALYWDGDTVAAGAAARAIALRLAARPTADPAARATRYRDACASAQWSLRQRRTQAAAAVLPLLRSGMSDDSAGVSVRAAARTCAALLDAMLAPVLRRPDARAALDRVDSLLTEGDPFATAVPYGNLVVARLREASGDVARALAAVRRRPPRGGPYRSTYLAEEGRLATLAGDSAAAVSAYEEYLSLRTDPESEVRPDVDRVRAELARLVGERGRRP